MRVALMILSIAFCLTTKPAEHDRFRIDDHRTNADFWSGYGKLPADIRARADKQFSFLKENPQHPSLHFKKLGDHYGQEIWSARVTLKYQASAVRLSTEYLWFWIGEHNVYDSRG